MSKKPQKTTKSKRGRKSIASGEDLLIEARLAIVADLWAGLRTRQEIIQHFQDKHEKELKAYDQKATKLYAVKTKQIDEYIAEVKRRWAVADKLESHLDKKQKFTQGLARTIVLAEKNRRYVKELGGFMPAPLVHSMLRGYVELAKLEGLLSAPTGRGELEDLLDELAQDRQAQLFKTRPT